MDAYYNEIEPFAAQWLRNLISAGHIAPGDVDERDILDVNPHDLEGYDQCHFFAGIGVWSYALRLARWPDERPVWTGSCPCQPFSAAGRGGGFADERHLWPAFFHLIGERRPPVVFGEQVASTDGLGWFDLVQTDLEGAGYACGAVDTCSAGVGAPHIRQRLRFAAVRLAHTHNTERRSEVARGNIFVGQTPGRHQGHREYGTGGAPSRLADLHGAGRSEGEGNDPTARHGHSAPPTGLDGRHGQPGPTNGPWRDADWLRCRDGKWRPVGSSTFPLVNGAASRVGRLRAYGNAIDAEATRVFIEAFLETAP